MKNFLPCLLIGTMIFSGFELKAQHKSPILSGKEKLHMYQSHEEMRDSSTFKDLHWQFIGPTNISGRCTDVEAVGPKGQNYTIWVAAASSGIWKSVNEGVTFEPVFENYGTTTIGDIAIAPSDPELTSNLPTGLVVLIPTLPEFKMANFSQFFGLLASSKRSGVPISCQ